MKTINYPDAKLINDIVFYQGKPFSGLILSRRQEDYTEDLIENGISTGLHKHYYANGQLCKLVNFKPQKNYAFKFDVEGDFSTYYENGKICETGRIINHRLTGDYECFYEDGSVFIKASFETDSLTGQGVCYYRTGKIAQKGDIHNQGFTERLNRRVLTVYLIPTSSKSFISIPYGIPYADHFFESNLYHPSRCDFDFAPYPRLLRNFCSFNREGKSITRIKEYLKFCHDEKREIVLTESCNERLQRHGQLCKFSFGKPSEIESYTNGVLNGLYLKLSYYGFVEIRGQYENGVKSGNWENYNDNGILKEEY